MDLGFEAGDAVQTAVQTAGVTKLSFGWQVLLTRSRSHPTPPHHTHTVWMPAQPIVSWQQHTDITWADCYCIQALQWTESLDE